MPRTSLKDVRTQEILSAFTKCVARYGLDGSTLARISEEAGIARPLLRHYLGNREEMIQRLLDHVLSDFATRTKTFFDMLPATGRIDALIEALFGRVDYSSESAAVFAALVAASERHKEIRQPLLRFVYEFEDRIAAEIRAENTSADPNLVDVAAAGITAIYFNTDAVMPLVPKEGWRDRQRAAALVLLEAACQSGRT